VEALKERLGGAVRLIRDDGQGHKRIDEDGVGSRLGNGRETRNGERLNGEAGLIRSHHPGLLYRILHDLPMP
jgi:hypothetical protein